MLHRIWLGFFVVAFISAMYQWLGLGDAEVFQRKHFKLKPHPYRVLYNYWYAGGLPISRSEIECLHLMKFALKRNFKMGVHYCSLENKHTGQVYKQNAFAQTQPTTYFSQRDFMTAAAGSSERESKISRASRNDAR